MSQRRECSRFLVIVTIDLVLFSKRLGKGSLAGLEPVALPYRLLCLIIARLMGTQPVKIRVPTKEGKAGGRLPTGKAGGRRMTYSVSTHVACADTSCDLPPAFHVKSMPPASPSFVGSQLALFFHVDFVPFFFVSKANVFSAVIPDRYGSPQNAF